MDRSHDKRTKLFKYVTDQVVKERAMGRIGFGTWALKICTQIFFSAFLLT